MHPIPTSASHRHRIGLSLGTAMLAVVLLEAHTAHASLALIREGPESKGTPESGDTFGRSVAVGDFNGDGREDLATGAPFEDVNGVSHCGCVIVNYAGKFGLKYQGAQLLLQSDGDALETGADFGWAVAAGDFDADGYDDLAIGVPTADADASHLNTGYVFVYAGGPSGLSYWHYLWQPGAGGSPESNDRFGASLCVGNFDGSATREDLAVGSPGEDGDAGAVFFFLGGTQGLLNGGNGWRKQSTYGGTNTAGDQFGYSLASGQLWGGGSEELVVGTPFKEVDSSSDAGVVWVILGTSTGLSSSSAQMIRPDEGDLPNTPFATGWFGYSVAAGRFWGGSYDGVAIGEPGRSYLGHPDSGRVVLGKGSLLGLSFTSPYAITLFQNDAGWNIGDNDLFGRALAAGYYDTNDGYEDLAVGSPGDNANGGATNAGVVSILFGGANGPGAHGWVGWAEDAWADPIEINDTFATSLAIGRFEDGGKGSLAIGAPGEDTGTGAVFIAAPWRQRQYPNYKTGLSADCEGNWVYALRPFDEVCIASTTKIMTVLIACERTQLPSNDPKFVSINASYTVPDWIRQHIGGSLYGFRDEQTLTLGDLLRCCLYPSGNDAAFAIADLLTGSNNSWGGAYDNSVQTFVDEMNDRASAIGMNDTYFTNPAGLDTGSPHSTAADMVKLAAVAMQNSRFRGVCSNTSYTFTSTYLSSSNLRVSFVDVLNYGFLQGLQNYDPSFNGLKPGWTPCAAVTGVYSTDNGDLGYALAATFGTPHTDGYRERYRADADAIMDIAQSHCGSALADGSDQQRGSGPLTQGGAADGFHVEFGAMSTQTGKYSGGAAEVWSFQSTRQQYLALDLTRPGGAGTTRCDLTLSRSGELDLAPGAQAELGIGPFESHGEIVLTNQGDTSVTVLFSATQIGPPIQFNIPAGGRAVVPAYSGPRVSSWTYSIQNPSTSTSVAIGLSESFSFALTGLAGGSTPVFSALLLEDDELVEQSVRADVQGTDPLAGRTVSVSLHDTNVLVDVPGSEVIGDAGAVAKLFPATPNPFSATTRLAYELPSAGPVRLDIIDPSGRRVRRFDRADAPAGRGSFEWDGLDEAGRGVAPGVFFYRLERDGREEASGRVIRVR